MTTLSDKIEECNCGLDRIPLDDIKQFINDLKKVLIDDSNLTENSGKWMKDIIDKLAGEKLYD